MSEKMSKKANMAYWDEIDDTIVEFIKEIAGFSTSDKKLSFEEGEEGTEFCDVYGDDILCDIRDMVIQYLEEKGAEFPFIDENY